MYTRRTLPHVWCSREEIKAVRSDAGRQCLGVAGRSGVGNPDAASIRPSVQWCYSFVTYFDLVQYRVVPVLTIKVNAHRGEKGVNEVAVRDPGQGFFVSTRNGYISNKTLQKISIRDGDRFPAFPVLWVLDLRWLFWPKEYNLLEVRRHGRFIKE